MIEVTVQIINSIVKCDVELPLIGVTFSGIKDDPINGNQITILDVLI